MKKLIRGFTLIELLVVIAIIVLLNAIIITNFTSSRSKARDAKRISDVGQIQLALALYFDRCKKYPDAPLTPTSSNGICPSLTPPVSLGTYTSIIPVPSGEAGQSVYDYVPSPNNVDYILHAKLEAANQAISDGLSDLPPTNVNGSDWYGVSFSGTFTGNGTQPTCSNTSTSLDYCLGPK